MDAENRKFIDISRNTTAINQAQPNLTKNNKVEAKQHLSSATSEIRRYS